MEDCYTYHCCEHRSTSTGILKPSATDVYHGQWQISGENLVGRGEGGVEGAGGEGGTR